MFLAIRHSSFPARVFSAPFALAAAVGLLFSCGPCVRADQIYVTYGTSDSGNHRVEEFLSSGTSGVNTDAGLVTDDLNTPTGIALDANGNLYVADSNAGTVTEFSPSGVNLGIIASSLTQPAGLTFDQFGNLYIASTDNNGTITEVSPGGSPTVIATGLDSPTGLAVQGNTLYVASFTDAAIYAVPLGGSGLRSFSTYVSHDGGFDNINHPVGITFDTAGDLYVVNAGLNTVEEFSPSLMGTVFASNPDTTANPSGINNPSGIAIDSSGDVYVTNFFHNGPEHTGTSTIVEYSASGALLDTFFVPNLRDASYIAINVPEPASLGLLGLGASILFAFRRRRARGHSA